MNLCTFMLKLNKMSKESWEYQTLGQVNDMNGCFEWEGATRT